jgi:hypothetical protein
VFQVIEHILGFAIDGAHMEIGDYFGQHLQNLCPGWQRRYPLNEIGGQTRAGGNKILFLQTRQARYQQLIIDFPLKPLPGMPQMLGGLPVDFPLDRSEARHMDQHRHVFTALAAQATHRTGQ